MPLDSVAIDADVPSPHAPTTDEHADPEHDQQRARVRLASILGTGLGGLVYFLALLDYGFHPLRGATAFRYAETFFDLQATALTHGHLSVPDGSLGIEGFVVGGRTYSYFGIFPALLRIPVQLVTHEFDGRLTVLSMAIAWVVFAVMTTRLYWLVRQLLRPDQIVGRVDVVVSAIFLAAATGGTTLTFDAAIPWAYHEVYVWSIASVMGSLYWLLRVLREPTFAHTRWLFVLVLIASLTRTTGGWSVCLVTIAAGVWFLRRRPEPVAVPTWMAVTLAGLVPLLVAITINYLKFRHAYMFPLENQVFTQVNRHRREILAQNNGTLAGIQFLPSSLVNYLSLDGVRFTSYFPWMTLPAVPAHGYHVDLDQGYRTGSVPTFMPLLFLLMLASVPMLFRRLTEFGPRTVRLAWFGAFLMTGGVMDYGYIANRYTSEFVPVLVIGGMVAVHTMTGWWQRRRARIGLVLVVLAAVLTVYSLTLQSVVGSSAAALLYKGPRLEDYVQRQVDVSGSSASFAKLVHHSDSLPGDGKADDLWIQGDCTALYLNNGGDDNEPWLLVQERDSALTVSIDTAKVRPGTYDLMHNTQYATRTVSIRVHRDRQAQLVITNGTQVILGQLFDLPPNAVIRVGARNMSDLGASEIRSTPGGLVGYVLTAQFDDLTQEYVLGSVVPDSSRVVKAPGITIAPAPTLPLPLCRRVAEAAGIKTSAN